MLDINLIRNNPEYVTRALQNKDGSVTIPEILRSYLGGKKIFEPVD